jgi:hypothetical protein
MKKKYASIKLTAPGLLLLLVTVNSSNAQLKGDHLVGDFCLSAGTQAPPTVIAALPFYWYGASTLKNSNGDVVSFFSSCRLPTGSS